MEQFDTLPLQCRHIEHMHEGVWLRKNNFRQNDSCENVDFHQTLQTCSYMQDKYFRQKSKGLGPILLELFPFVVLNGF